MHPNLTPGLGQGFLWLTGLWDPVCEGFEKLRAFTSDQKMRSP